MHVHLYAHTTRTHARRNATLPRAKLQQLQAIFGQTPVPCLASVLLDHDDDVERASDALCQDDTIGGGLVAHAELRRVCVELGPAAHALWESDKLADSDRVSFLHVPEGISGRSESARIAVISGTLRSEAITIHVLRGPELVGLLEAELNSWNLSASPRRSLVGAVEACAHVLASGLRAPSGGPAAGGAPVVVVVSGVKQALNKCVRMHYAPCMSPGCPAVLAATEFT